MVAAFEGWNDAGDAATTALRSLADVAGARTVASIDPEAFTDFAVSRPYVRLGGGGERTIEWPRTDLLAGSLPGGRRDLVLMIGPEPRLRWQTYCGVVLDVAGSLGARTLVTLGALLADVVHTAPVQVVGGSSDPATALRLGLRTSRYEGPTGIVGVLGHVARERGMDIVSMWAPVPTYVPGATSPKAALALVRSVATYLDAPVADPDLEEAAAEYEQSVDELVAADDELADYVRQLILAIEDEPEIIEDQLPDSPGELVAEVERFLRDQKRPPGG